jgi:hypothetical protein
MNHAHALKHTNSLRKTVPWKEFDIVITRRFLTFVTFCGGCALLE